MNNARHTQKYALILMKNPKQLEVNSCQTCQYWIYSSRRRAWIARSSQFVLFHTEWFNRCAERALERYIRNIFRLIIFFSIHFHIRSAHVNWVAFLMYRFHFILTTTVIPSQFAYKIRNISCIGILGTVYWMRRLLNSLWVYLIYRAN